ncbi:hypothetical protein C8Q73DRAFT_419193 [Cubamyces lactineus]|nr:hypothetical protein C8Q73DRAFT_419193 [Cubamyces lactineus]
MGVPRWLPLQIFGNSRSLNASWRAWVVQVRSSTRLPPLPHYYRLCSATDPRQPQHPYPVIPPSYLSLYPITQCPLSLPTTATFISSSPQETQTLLPPRRQPPSPIYPSLLPPTSRVRPPAGALAPLTIKRMKTQTRASPRRLGRSGVLAASNVRQPRRRALNALKTTSTAAYSVPWTGKSPRRTESLRSPRSTMESRPLATSRIRDVVSYGEFSVGTLSSPPSLCVIHGSLTTTPIATTRRR